MKTHSKSHRFCKWCEKNIKISKFGIVFGKSLTHNCWDCRLELRRIKEYMKINYGRLTKKT